MAAEQSPRLEITPRQALVDERVNVKLTGLSHGQVATIRASIDGDWESRATFEANQDGVVDPASQSPIEGTYQGIEPMGLFWSMVSTGANARSLLSSEDTAPVDIAFTAEVNGTQIGRASFKRLFAAPGVTRRVIRENGLFGTFFQPDGSGPHPAIFLLSGSGGGLNENLAALYASRGIAALALAYFNYETLQADLSDIPLEYFEIATRWLQAQDCVDGDRIAVRGGSRGGELSLLLGSMFPQIKAVISYVPSSMVWGSVTVDPSKMNRPAWTYRGKAIDYVPRGDSPELTAMDQEHERKGEPIPLTPRFLTAIKDVEAVQAATISVENINGAVLLVSGGDDRMWPSSRFSEMVMERLDRSNFPHPYKHLSYRDAGHVIGTPYLPTTMTSSKHPVRGTLFAYGGNAKAYADAAEDSWAQGLAFLKENL